MSIRQINPLSCPCMIQEVAWLWFDYQNNKGAFVFFLVFRGPDALYFLGDDNHNQFSNSITVGVIAILEYNTGPDRNYL